MEPSRSRAKASWLGIGALAVCAACAGGGVGSIERKLDERIGEDTDRLRYALELAKLGKAPYGERLIERGLNAKNYGVLLEAARAAAARPSGTLAPVLKRVFEAKGGAARLYAALALAKLGDAESLAWIAGHALDESGRIQPAVVRYLLERGEREAVVRAVTQALRDPAQEVRDEVYELLGEIGEPWVVPLILDAFERERGEGRRTAIAALGRAGNAEVAKHLRPFLGTRGLVFVTAEALGNLGDRDSVKRIEALLREPDASLHAYVAAALWKLGDVEVARGVVERLMQHKDPAVRRLLAEQLGTVDEPEAHEYVIRLSRDEDALVRRGAVGALAARAERGESELLPILRERIADEDYQTAAVALATLARIGGGDLLGELRPLLDHRNVYVIISAGMAMLEISNRQQNV